MQYTTEVANKLITNLNILNKLWADQLSHNINNKKKLKQKYLLTLMKLKQKKNIIIKKRRTCFVKQQLLRNQLINTMRRTSFY